MRIAILTLLITLIALPLMAKGFDSAGTNEIAARLMAVVSDSKSQPVAGETEVVSLAAELNAINVGAGE